MSRRGGREPADAAVVRHEEELRVGTEPVEVRKERIVVEGDVEDRR